MHSLSISPVPGAREPGERWYPASMLHALRTFDSAHRAASLRSLQGALDEAQDLVGQLADKCDTRQLAQIEAEVHANPQQHILFNAQGEATLSTFQQRHQAGRFEVLSLATLRARAHSAVLPHAPRSARIQLSVLDGASPLTDIGFLQAIAPPGCLFQVASQFNCLEAPDPTIVPVAEYLQDPTQGPRASVSAFPGTLVRHYAAPGPHGRFVQVADGPQINLLAAVCDPEVARVRNGYLLPSEIPSPARFVERLAARFESLCVGVHSGVEVVFGGNWNGAVPHAPHQTIDQVFTSTLATGGYSDAPLDPAVEHALIQHLQRAAYLGTLLSAAALGNDLAVLTLIGGGVFGNPHQQIWEAILWATRHVEPLLHRDLHVVINGRNLGQSIPPDTLAATAQSMGGVFVRCERTGPVVR